MKKINIISNGEIEFPPSIPCIRIFPPYEKKINLLYKILLLLKIKQYQRLTLSCDLRFVDFEEVERALEKNGFNSKALY